MAIPCCPLESREWINILQTKFVEVWGEEKVQSPACQEEVGEVPDWEILSDLKKELVRNPKDCHAFYLEVSSSCQQVSRLASCNMLAVKYEFLDTCFKRLYLGLWTKLRDKEGINDLLDKNI